MSEPLKIKLTEQGFETELPAETIIIDNKGNGHSPSDLMIASLAGCSALVFRNILSKKRMAYTDLWLEATAEKVPEEANRISAVHIHFKITGTDLDATSLDKALKLVPKHCSMARSVEGSIEITESVEIISE
ncbi:peroxiredoxin, OsmC subfamily [Listeria grayi]|uniref:OsmC-like protein n=2 Tax=Listeria grayi TaxID=1641 RepID=D7UU45_LISGR|nr:OsmC family protein [Listeria grayi]EFI85293.1 OsmC-like protein [Listeria grayi DSM 20601]MBC1922804.1 OsmC family protein [Listeria grayi]STY43017.1 peroxiredoxin, OsmC subfamily [Listeria grayi]VEI33601.1 peroxiredoxin, OsmC subfamily [Listeria grayi]